MAKIAFILLCHKDPEAIIKQAERLTARLPKDTLTGIFESVDAHGALVLRTSCGTKAVTVGDVFFAAEGG